MDNTIKFSVDVKNSGKRLDVFLTNNLKDFSRSSLKKLIDEKRVKLNNNTFATPSTKVKFRDQIEVNIIGTSNIVLNCLNRIVFLFCSLCNHSVEIEQS